MIEKKDPYFSQEYQQNIITAVLVGFNVLTITLFIYIVNNYGNY